MYNSRPDPYFQNAPSVQAGHPAPQAAAQTHPQRQEARVRSGIPGLAEAYPGTGTEVRRRPALLEVGRVDRRGVVGRGGRRPGVGLAGRWVRGGREGVGGRGLLGLVVLFTC